MKLGEQHQLVSVTKTLAQRGANITASLVGAVLGEEESVRAQALHKEAHARAGRHAAYRAPPHRARTHSTRRRTQAGPHVACRLPPHRTRTNSSRGGAPGSKACRATTDTQPLAHQTVNVYQLV